VDLAKITGKAHNDDAIYYRMEQLRMLGFIEKTRYLSDRTFRYALSPGYRAVRLAKKA
jgi:hypothetical protein